jgi:hypothetical protein
MTTIVWIALPIAVLGSIQLIARVALSKGSAVKVRGHDVRPRHR